ncbi:MAG: ADP-glyceromanno-heptose 6-epimerase [Candidatus Omnitrophica bacterium]|nr:ADP-glyceromanno-heptose 6-epimerase [Candidatus Omnitrophota bacterium]
MIIVTGGAGFIGSALIWGLNRKGFKDILVVDQNAAGSPKWGNLDKLSYTAYFESSGFLTSLEQGKWNTGVSAILHMGACSDTTEKNTAFLRENNTLYSERLAAWAIRHNVYFAYASSAAAYGAGERGFSDDDDTLRLKALNPYGQSKLDFDLSVLRNKWETQVTGFRFFNVYGPNEYHKGAMRSMVHKGFEQIQSGGKLRLFKSYKAEYPDGGQKRDFVYVKDVVDLVLWFMEHPAKKGIYNVGAGRAQSWNELAEALFKACRKPVQIEYVDMPESIKNQYQYFTQADLTKLRQTNCPVTFQNLETGVSDYVKHHLLREDPYLS